MKDFFKIIGLFLLTTIIIVAVGYGLGWFGVFSTKTVGKAQQNATTEVYENTNAFTKAKRQEILKYYKEYQKCETEEEREAIAEILALSLADFDEDKYIKDYKLLQFVKKVKY